MLGGAVVLTGLTRSGPLFQGLTALAMACRLYEAGWAAASSAAIGLCRRDGTQLPEPSAGTIP